MAETDPAYIAKRPCGCIVAATVGLPQFSRSVARDLRDWHRRGLVIHRTTVGEARAMPNFLVDCTCDKEPQKETLFA